MYLTVDDTESVLQHTHPSGKKVTHKIKINLVHETLTTEVQKQTTKRQRRKVKIRVFRKDQGAWTY